MQDVNDQNNRDIRKELIKPGKKEKKTSYKNHKNKFIRMSARAGYTIWIVILVIGMSLAFIVSLFLL